MLARNQKYKNKTTNKVCILTDFGKFIPTGEQMVVFRDMTTRAILIDTQSNFIANFNEIIS